MILATAAAIAFSVSTPQKAEAGTVEVATCGGGTISMNNAEQRVLQQHNRARTTRGLRALCVQPTLTRAARAHSGEMINRDYFSHNSFDGETVRDRLARFGYFSQGYSYFVYAENIAWGCRSYASSDRIFDGWMQSQSHRSNILNEKYRQVGIGVRRGTYKSCDSAAMYTVDFGTRLR